MNKNMRVKKGTQLQLGGCNFCTRENCNFVYEISSSDSLILVRFCEQCLEELVFAKEVPKVNQLDKFMETISERYEIRCSCCGTTHVKTDDFYEDKMAAMKAYIDEGWVFISDEEFFCSSCKGD